MALGTAQAKLLGKMMRDLTALRGMWSVPGKGVYPAEVEEGTNWEAGRLHKHCGPQWDNAESDGFTSVMSRILNKATEIREGDEVLSVGRKIDEGAIPEVKLQADGDSKADKWGLAINEAREESVRVFTDGSMNEEGRVGGWHVEGSGGWGEGMTNLATVWDGEIVGMRGGLQMVPGDRKVLVLSDSQAAIAAV